MKLPPSFFSIIILGILGIGGEGVSNAAENQEVEELEFREFEVERLLQYGVYTEAARRLEDQLLRHPEDVTTRRNLIKVYLETEDYYKVVEHAKMLVELRPEDEEAAAWLALGQEKVAEVFPVALAEAEEALALSPEDTHLRRNLIHLLTLGGKPEEAIEQFQILMEQEPDNLLLLRDYARTLSWLERYDEALAAYEEYVDQTGDDDVRIEMARVLAWKGNFGRSARELREMIREDPENLEAQVLLADIYRWNDDTQAAAEMYERVLESDPANPGALAGLEELTALAELRRYQALRLSIPAMEERIAEDPEDWESRLQLARLYGAAGRYDDVRTQLELYLEAHPDDFAVQRDYAFALTMLEEYEQSIRILRRYLQEHPNDVGARMQIVNMLMWEADYDRARVELREVLELDPDHVEAHWQLARLHHMHEEWDRALWHYERVRELDPSRRVVEARIREITVHPRYQLMELERRIAEDPGDVRARLDLARELIDLERYFEAQAQAQAILDLEEGHSELKYLAQRKLSCGG